MSRYRPHRIALALAILLTVTTAACRRDPTPAERRTRGEDIVRKVSETIAAAQTLSFSAEETTEVMTRDGGKRIQHVTRDVKLRRPDRLWFMTLGDRNLEGLYEGKQLTVLLHDQKVFGVVRTSTTIDEAVQEISERYNIPLPVGDLLTTNPHATLISSATTGGWDGEENVDGTMCARVAWHHPNVDWTIWVPSSGAALPKRLWVDYKSRPRRPTIVLLFKNWNLSPVFDEKTFQSHVPSGYEGVAVIQRAAAVLSNGQAEPAATTGTTQPPK